jgi:hypothetical protein
MTHDTSGLEGYAYLRTHSQFYVINPYGGRGITVNHVSRLPLLARTHKALEPATISPDEVWCGGIFYRSCLQPPSGEAHMRCL